MAARRKPPRRIYTDENLFVGGYKGMEASL